MKKFKVLSIFMALFFFAGFTLAATPSTLKKNVWRAEQTFKHGIKVEDYITLNGSRITFSATSTVYYVRSTTGSDTMGNNYGLSFDKPWATVDYAINNTEADVGDVIIALPSHAETFTGADGFDADVAGISIIGIGSGTDMPTFTFGHANATIAVGAANVRFENLRFLAGITAVTIGIAVEKAGDDFTMFGCVFPEPAASASDFIDAIDLEDDSGGPSNTRILYNEYYHMGGVGPAHFLDAGNSVNSGLQVVGNILWGEFSVAAIWSDTHDLRVLIKDNNVIQMTSTEHAIEFTGNATGFIDGNRVFTDAEGTSIDPGIMNIGVNYVSTAVDVSGVVYPTEDTGWGRIGAFSGDGGANDDDSIKASLDLAHTDLDTIIAATPAGHVHVAAVTSSADTTHSVYSSLTGYGTDYFVNGWTMIVIWDAAGAGGAPETEVVDVSAYATGTGTFTHGATTQLVATDVVMFIRDEFVSMYQKALPTIVVANSLGAFIASGGTGLGTELADSKSLVDAIGTNGTTVADTATGIAGMIGINDANNAMDTSTVVPNVDGSVYERLEGIGVGGDINFDNPNYIGLSVDLSQATWNTAAAHEILTVTGMIRLKMIIEVSATVEDAGDACDGEVGIAGNTAAIIATGAIGGAGAGSTLEAGEFWIDASPADATPLASSSAVLDFVVSGGLDVGYTLSGAAATAGTLIFHMWWVPLDSTGLAAVGAGGVF